MTYIPTMGGRIEYLDGAIAGFKATGRLMVSLVNGSLSSAGPGDDPGIYYFVPVIARVTGLDAAQAMELFQFLAIGLTLVVGSIASWHSFVSREAKLLGCAGVIGATVLAFGVADVYMFPPLFVAAAVPVVVATVRKKQESSLLPTLVLVGLAAGLTNFLRAHAATGVVLFALVILLWQRRERRDHAWATAALVAGLLLALVLTRIELHRRDAYLRSAIAEFRPNAQAHPLWGQVYIGFAFLSNPYVSAYADNVAMERLAAVAPGVNPMTDEADRVYRSEVMKLAAAHPWLTLRTLAAKTGVIVLFLSVFIVCIVLARLPHGKFDGLDAAFVVAILFYSLPGLLTIPTVQYVAGAIAAAVMYAAYATAIARDHVARVESKGT